MYKNRANKRVLVNEENRVISVEEMQKIVEETVKNWIDMDGYEKDGTFNFDFYDTPTLMQLTDAEITKTLKNMENKLQANLIKRGTYNFSFIK